MRQMTPLARALATSLFDNAALFPPARAPMETALGLHALARSGPHAFCLGRFLVPAAALPTLARERELLDDVEALTAGVIVGSPADPTGAQARLDVATDAATALAGTGIEVDVIEYRPPDQTVTGLEQAARDAAAAASALDADAYVEVGVAGHAPGAVAEHVAAVAEAGQHRVGVKVRCAGADPSMVPEDAALASFVAAACARALPFKATAGLHHALAVPYGAERRHGFLNLLIATIVACAGHDVRAIEVALASPDLAGVVLRRDGLHAMGDDYDLAVALAIRARFVAFGTCSFTEPLADLLAIDPLLEPQP